MVIIASFSMYMYFLQDRAVVLYGAQSCEILYVYKVLMCLVFSLQRLFHVISTLVTFYIVNYTQSRYFLPRHTRTWDWHSL